MDGAKWSRNCSCLPTSYFRSRICSCCSATNQSLGRQTLTSQNLFCTVLHLYLLFLFLIKCVAFFVLDCGRKNFRFLGNVFCCTLRTPVVKKEIHRCLDDKRAVLPAILLHLKLLQLQWYWRMELRHCRAVRVSTLSAIKLFFELVYV